MPSGPSKKQTKIAPVVLLCPKNCHMDYREQEQCHGPYENISTYFSGDWVERLDGVYTGVPNYEACDMFYFIFQILALEDYVL